MTNDRLLVLRQCMEKENVQALIVPTSDFHDTEYVCDFFKARAYFSGFTGSAGTLVVLQNKAGLWTDGRYFIQAAHELKGSGIELMKMGEPDTPSIPEYIIANLKAGQTVAFDGRCVSMADYDNWSRRFAAHELHTEVFKDIPGMAWKDRPNLPATETFHYDEQYTGKTTAEKLADVRLKMEEEGVAHHLITKVDEIAWLYNLRANDIPCFPVALSYTILDQDGGTLYINQERLDPESRSILEENGIQIKDYDAIYDDVKQLEGPVMMEKDFVNSTIGCSVKEPVWKEDPIVLMKACKNPVELEGARQAHIKDGAAVIRFWKWLEEQMAAGNGVTEISAADQLQKFRAQMPDYLEDSFDTISAYKANAAMAHYHPDSKNPVQLENKGLFLVDSGGQYLQGTTDITRTFVLGDLTDEEREAFTLVLQGHIDLASARFLHGARGMNLDILARGPLWNKGMDYNHGTGHGVGALSNVHEAPNGIRWRIVPERNDSCVLEEGMITSNEPGMYEEGKFGIRHENLMAVKKAMATPYGQFMEHEILTLVPFDVRGLDLALMSPDQINWLNAYHERVKNEISPLLNEEEKAWLAEKTKPVLQ